MSPRSSVKVAESIGRTILELRAEELRQKREARNAEVGKNRANALADLNVAFPDEWERDLRAVSPITTVYSHLRAYWYRAGQRWILYDVLPVEAIDDELDTGSGITGAELKQMMAGPRPSELTEDVPISDVQHEMFRRWKGFARPFWVLQGENGGHQVKFSPVQSSALLRMGLPSEPPAIGALPPCPFDARAATQLQHLNRLHGFEDSIDRLRRSGSAEYANAEHQRLERDVREAEMRFIEAQMRPLVDMASTLSQRSEHEDQLVQMSPGTAARSVDAYDRYRETGDFTI